MAGERNEEPPVIDLALLRDSQTNRARYDLEWQSVFRRYDPALRAYFKAQGVRGSPLDELLGEIWAAAYRHIAALEDVDAMWGWLRKIGVNARLLGARGRKRRTTWEQAKGELVMGDAPPDPLEPLLARDPEIAGVGVGVLRERLAALPEIDRRYATHYVVEEMSHADASAACNWSEDVGQKRWQRIKRRLRGDD
jgi:DNA-directed RNA polymerase specialized sigma24 family protein